MKEEADLIASKCGGLPKVIVTLARQLTTRPRDKLKQEMRRLTDNFMQELSTNPGFYPLQGILALMHSYLHSGPVHLKKSVLYLTNFPRDTIIRKRRLVRRWIAEGYLKGIDMNNMEKCAENLFDELSAMGIMQLALKRRKVIGYRVSGFFHEYVISRPVEEKFLFPVEISLLEQQYGRQTTEAIGHHLAIGTTFEIDRILFESLDISRLRSLTVFGFLQSFYISDRMRVLRVLDLENASGMQNKDLERIGKLPARLKFLSLRGHRLISLLPDSLGLGDLMQLQTLDVRDTSIVMLPPCITRLRNLQYIRAGTTVPWTHDDSLAAEEHPTSSSRRSNTLTSRLLARLRRRRPDSSCSGGVEVPRGMRRLKALQTLGAIYVNNADGDAVRDEILSLLCRQLKKLEVSGINRTTRARKFLYDLDCTDHLESLSLGFEKNNPVVYWSSIWLPSSLRSLKMQGHVDQLPLQIKYLGNLVKLTLQKTTLFTPDDIDVLGWLPSLGTLRLRVNNDQDGRQLQFPIASFNKLQLLEIASKSKLHVRFDEGAMGKLEQFKIHCLQGSEMQFSGLDHPVSLKQVWLLGFFDDALKEALQQQLVSRHPKKPAPKLEVEPYSS